MYYPIRKELVGKRFMCVRDRPTQNSRPNSRSNRFSNPVDYTWKCGIIRACSEEDSDNIEQKVLVEYDNQDWSSREWINIYNESWKIFLVEKTMVWAQREDPNNPKRPILWPGLTFYSLVDKHGLDESKVIGVEFLGDHFRVFCTSNEMREYQEDDGLQPALRNNTKVVNELINWQTLQKSQGILIHGPFTLTGFRVQVYREKCRQWFSAVITSHDLLTREMNVMDDTVLQTHRINPRLVMVLLLANEVELDSMLRGDLVRVLPPRRNRQSQVVITSPGPDTNRSGNSMWQFLTNMWSGTSSSHSGKDSNVRYSPSLPTNKTLVEISSTQLSDTQKRSTSRSSQDDISLHPSHVSSPVKSSLGKPFPSGSHLSSPNSKPAHHQSRYSSMEDLLCSSSSPQGARKHISAQRPNSASIICPSPHSPFSSPHLRTPPRDQRTTPPRDQRTTPPRYQCTTPPRYQHTTPPSASDSKHGLLGSPCLSNVSPYTPPRSSASLSPFRVSERGTMFGSPALSGLEGVAGSVMQDCAPPLHCLDPEAHLMAACSCNSKKSTSQAILTNQLHALQLQQQHHLQQQQQNLSHCQMYISELQLLANRLKAVQQGSLTPEQREMLNLHYKQMLVQYQEASMSDYHSPAVSAAQLQMQMQLKYLEDQEKQLKYAAQPHMHSFDLEQLKSHMSIGGNPEHLHNIFTGFSPPKQNHESKEMTKNLDKNKQTVKEHVARLKRFMPNSQCQEKSPSLSTASSSANFLSHGQSCRVELEKKSNIHTASTHFTTYKENNKTDDQKVVDALVNNKSSVSEKGTSLTSPKDLTSNEEASQTNITTDDYQVTIKKTREQSMQDNNKIQDRIKPNSDPFGFDQIADDVVPSSKSSPNLKSSLLHNLLQNDIVPNVLNKTSSPIVSQESPTSSNVTKLNQDEEKCSTHGIILRIHPTCESPSKGGNTKTMTKKVQSKKCTRNQAQVVSDESSIIMDTSDHGTEMANSRIIAVNATQRTRLKEVPDKVTKPQDGNLITKKTDRNLTPNRASVIVYVDNNCSSKLDANLVTCAPKDQSLTSSKVNLQVSVKTLLEPNKTSSHITVKGLERQELPILGSNIEPKSAKKPPKNTKREGKGKKCKKQKMDKNTTESGEIPQSNPTKLVEQMPTSQNPFSDSLQDSSLESETAISSSQDLVSRFLGHDGKTKIFPDLNILTSNLSSADEHIQQCRTFDSKRIERKFPKLSKEEELRPREVKKSHGQKMIREDKNLMQPSEKSLQLGCCNYSNIAVNFVSDQTVRSLTTVNRAQEPVALSSLVGTEYSVKQIKREDCDEVKMGLAEQRRQRKKSRKVLENESLDERTKDISSSEPKKCKDTKAVHNDVVKNMDKKKNKCIKLEKVKGSKKAVKTKGEGNCRPLNTDSNFSVGSGEPVVEENVQAWQKPQEEQNAIGEKAEKYLEESNQNQINDDERKGGFPVEVTELIKPPLQRSCSEDTIELNLECGERLSEVMNDIADLSSTKHSSIEVENDDQQMKDDNVTEEIPLKEIVDQIASKKKTVTKKPRKRKKPEEKCEGQEIKKRKVMQPKDDFFIQNGSCAMFPKLPRCRDCRDKDDDTGSSPNQNCCRFALFRRLKKKRRSGKIHVAGFMLPENAEQDDLRPWIACDDVIKVLCKDEAQYILSHIADEFCSLVKEEKEVKKSRGDEAVISYKRAVGGLREMCDACATTIFNMHWVCHRCGFGVCLDCYNLRVKEKTNTAQFGRKMFQFKWFHCIPGLYHQPKNLIIAQIIPKQVLNELSDKLHQTRARWDLGNDCPCRHDSEILNAEESQDISKPLELSNDVCKPETQQSLKDEGISNPDNKGPEDKVFESKSSTKTTLMEKVRERLKGKLESQKIASVGIDVSSNLQEAKNTKEDKELTVESAKILEFSRATLVNTSSDAEIKDEEFIGTCPTIQPVNISQTINTTISQVATVKKTQKKDYSSLSSGLSLLLNYDSSSDGSAENSPQKCHVESGATSSAFDFNLGLLALVASKRTETLGKQQLVEQRGTLEKESKAMDLSKEELCRKDVVEATNIVGIHNIVTCTSGESTCSTATTSSIERRDQGEPSLLNENYQAPHSFMCNQRLLRLHEPHHHGNQELFAKRWTEGKPVLVSNIDKLLDRDLWSPESFEKEFGQEIADVVNCRTGKTLESFNVGDFWKGFECVRDRALDSNGEPMLLKLKDWPPGDDFCEKLPSRFKNLMDHIPLPSYTQRDGLRNLASRLPSFFVKPDLGPKMYNAYGSAAFPNEGTTNLHIDMSDAVNIMVYVGVPRDEGAGDRERAAAIKAVDIACDEIQQQRVRRETARIGALWHIFEVHDADKIREFLLEVGKERKMKYSSHHDPIHDQCFYLDEDLLGRLKRDHGVEGYAICQCLGDGVFIPAGAPHQVRNLYSCVKIAEDFVSPERIGQCLKTTQEFRHLSDKHTNHEDKLQIKNMIYHAVKDAVHVLQNHEKNSLCQN